MFQLEASNSMRAEFVNETDAPMIHVNQSVTTVSSDRTSLLSRSGYDDPIHLPDKSGNRKGSFQSNLGGYRVHKLNLSLLAIHREEPFIHKTALLNAIDPRWFVIVDCQYKW